QSLVEKGIAGASAGRDLQSNESAPDRPAVRGLGDHLLADVAALRVADGLPQVRLEGDGILAEFAPPARHASQHARGLERGLPHRPAAEATSGIDESTPDRDGATRLAPDLEARDAEQEGTDDKDAPLRRVDPTILVGCERGYLHAERGGDRLEGPRSPRAEALPVLAEVLKLAVLGDEVLVQVSEDGLARGIGQVDPDLLLAEAEDAAVAQHAPTSVHDGGEVALARAQGVDLVGHHAVHEGGRLGADDSQEPAKGEVGHANGLHEVAILLVPRAIALDLLDPVLDTETGAERLVLRPQPQRARHGLHIEPRPRDRNQASAAFSASTYSRSVAVPPRSRVRTLPSPRTFSMAPRNRAAASCSPRCRSIISAERRTAVGLATPLPAMSGAVPWTASNTAAVSPMLAPPTTPSPPTRPAQRSLMMSP